MNIDMNADQLMQQAAAHRRAGRAAGAENLYRQIIAAQPRHATALHQLALLKLQAAQNTEALDLAIRATAAEPNVPEYHTALGRAHFALAHPDQAESAFARATALRPGYVEAWYNLGTAQAAQRRWPQAVDAFRRALAMHPQLVEAHLNLGSALRELGQLDAAVAELRAAVTLRPQSAETHLNLARVLLAQFHFDQAAAAARSAINIDPSLLEAHFTLGAALMNLAKLDDAITAFTQEIALRPNSAETRAALGMTRLLAGDLPAAWPDYEFRLRTAERFSPHAGFSQPQWDGSDLDGRRILLHAEQGLGDTIQFARYVPLVAQRGGQVVLEVQPDLMRLMQTLPGHAQLIPQGQPLPNFDVHSPLLSLPGAFHTSLTNIPAQVPYLQPDPVLADHWRDRLAAVGGVKVGLAWSGNPNNWRNRIRSIPLSSLAPLAQIPNVRFINLQKGQAAAEQSSAPQLHLIDQTHDLTDLADTAALIANLDLVITIDTAIAHLAGALGKPVWIILAFVPDWRWLMNRADTPWYPTARLFRQPTLGDWPGVVARLSIELAQFAAEAAP